MPKYYLTTTRLCPVDFVHAIEAADADEARWLMDEGEGEYLGCSIGESLDLCEDETETSAERPSIFYPDKPALPYLLAALEEAARWIEAELGGRLDVEPLMRARAAIAQAHGEGVR
jgi:hypothetical protein